MAAKGARAKRAAVTGKRERLEARFRQVPDLYQPVGATGSEAAPVRAEGQAAYRGAVAAEDRLLLAAGQIPELEGQDGTARGHVLAVGGKGHRHDHRLMPG